MTLDAETLDRLRDAVRGAALTEPEDQAPYLREWRDRYVGRSPLVARPATTDEVSSVLRIASERGVSVVPQGGNTGLVGGQIPEMGDEIVVSLGRMNRIRALDPLGATMTVEAGVTLAEVQAAAGEAGLFFPLSIASEGTAQIGGILSTNAGGTAVLAYGNARDLVLGLEVVLADGRIWSGLNRLRKDNTGYDLKHLFVGGEGTLGLITAAVLRLLPKPRARETVFVGLASADDAVTLFGIARDLAGAELTSFELMPRLGLEMSRDHKGARDPLAGRHEWYVLMELSSPREGADLSAVTEAIFLRGDADGLIEDAAIAQSLDQAHAFWHVRESLSEAQKPEGGSIKHDVSVPIHAIPDFFREAGAAVEALMPGARPVPFGHVGDGNIHYNVSQPVGADKAAFLACYHAMNDAVHAVVSRFEGSISAEHGIGRAKRHMLAGVEGPVAMDMMRAIKRALDPQGLLNPGKVLPIDDS